MRKPNLSVLAAVALILALAGSAWADDEAATPWAQAFYSPDLITAHQRDIGLTKAQQEKLSKEFKDASGELAELKVKLEAIYQDAVALARQAGVDEAKQIAAVDLVLKLESTIKRRHALMLIRIRALLTDKQRKQLDALAKKSPAKD